MIGEHECHYSPLLGRHCCRMKGLHTDRRPLQSSVHDECYCAVLRDPPQNPNCPPQSRKTSLFKCSVSLGCQGCEGEGCVFTQGYLFSWCQMLNVVARTVVLHSKSLRFTLHLRGVERRPSSFICPSMIPSLLSGDGCHAAQSPLEMGSFHHAHTPQSRSPLRMC